MGKPKLIETVYMGDKLSLTPFQLHMMMQLTGEKIAAKAVERFCLTCLENFMIPDQVLPLFFPGEPPGGKTPDLNLEDNLDKTLDELRETLMAAKEAAPKDLIEKSGLQVENIFLPFNHLFTQAAKRAMSQDVTEIPHKRKLSITTSLFDFKGQIVADPVMFFGCQAIGERKIFDAAKTIANVVNECAAKGWITGAMSPKLILIRFVNEPHELEKFAVMSYVSMTQEGYDAANKIGYSTIVESGGVPKAKAE